VADTRTIKLEPVTLTGSVIRLEPLSLAHVPALAEVGLDPELWRWIPHPVTNVEQMQAYVEEALARQAAGAALPFAIVDAATAATIGSTRYEAIEARHRRLEIGWTWVAKAWQRTRANTEAKLLLLTHAFEVLRMNRVEIKTDVLNEQSRRAIERLGAVQEGIFRRHVITASGRSRDTVYYSIIDGDWPAIKARLLSTLQRNARP
jgi:RimJ/RimL family protein N-acetyltransferase